MKNPYGLPCLPRGLCRGMYTGWLLSVHTAWHVQQDKQLMASRPAASSFQQSGCEAAACVWFV